MIKAEDLKEIADVIDKIFIGYESHIIVRNPLIDGDPPEFWVKLEHKRSEDTLGPYLEDIDMATGRLKYFNIDDVREKIKRMLDENR